MLLELSRILQMPYITNKLPNQVHATKSSTEPNSTSDIAEFPRTSCNQRFQYSFHSGWPLDPVLSLKSQGHSSLPVSLSTIFILLHLHLDLPIVLFSFTFRKKTVCIMFCHI